MSYSHTSAAPAAKQCQPAAMPILQVARRMMASFWWDHGGVWVSAKGRVMKGHEGLTRRVGSIKSTIAGVVTSK